MNDILNKSPGNDEMPPPRAGIPSAQVPSEPVKLAMTVVATGPIVLLYPFLQKYFVKGGYYRGREGMSAAPVKN